MFYSYIIEYSIFENITPVGLPLVSRNIIFARVIRRRNRSGGVARGDGNNYKARRVEKKCNECAPKYRPARDRVSA